VKYVVFFIFVCDRIDFGDIFFATCLFVLLWKVVVYYDGGFPVYSTIIIFVFIVFAVIVFDVYIKSCEDMLDYVFCAFERFVKLQPNKTDILNYPS
jgi:hypothetical protein